MEEAEAEVGATKQPTYPKVAVFNLGRAHVWWRERREKERSTSLSGARFKWTDCRDWGGKNWRQMRHAGEAGDTPVATEEMRKLDEQEGKHSNRLREPLHLHNLHAT